MERPWIKHDGKGCPVSRGTRVDIIRRLAGPAYGVIALSEGSGLGRSWREECWPEFDQNEYYRLASDLQAECDRHSSYQDLFHKIGEGHSFPSIDDPNPIFEPVVPAPEKVG